MQAWGRRRKCIAPTAAICFRRNTPIARNAAEKFIKTSEKQWLCQKKQTTVFYFLGFYFMFSLFPSPFPVNAF